MEKVRMKTVSESAPSEEPASDRASSKASRGEVLNASFKTREVVELLGVSRRQLQYWAKTGLIEPSTRTPGGHHRYSFDDLVSLKATKRLIDAGISVQKIRKSVQALQTLLPRVGRPLSELVLVATGDVVLVFREGTAFEAVSGQEWVFEVAAFEREVAVFRHPERHPERQPVGSGETGDAVREAFDEEAQAEGPTRPGPRGARRSMRDWSRTG